MPPRVRLVLALAAPALLSAAPASAAPPTTLPALPTSGAATASSPADASATAGTDANADPADARRGIVQIEQGGRPLAIGTVLARDGRVLTSLSGVARIEQPELRYADGTVVKARVGHKDPTWDLALLVPLTGRWLEGLIPTDSDPRGLELKAFLPKAGKLAASPIGVKGRVDARSREGSALKDLLDVDLKGGPAVPGAPLLEADGRVVGVLVRACKDSAPPAPTGGAAKGGGPGCAPATYAAPVYALRTFLQKAPASAVQPAPWLGLGGAPTDAGNVRGIRVVGIAPGSPAEKAGLRASGDAPDTIVAVEGQPVETPELLAEAIAKRSVGQTVKLLVFSRGAFREVPVTLRAAPK